MITKDTQVYEETNESKIKIAKIISLVTQPPIICIPAFLVLCWIFCDGNLAKFALTEAICFIFTTFASMAIILLWAKKLNTDIDISNKEDRPIPLIIGSVCYFIGFLILLFINAPPIITYLLLCYTFNTLIVMVISTKWKISIHTTGLIGPASALIIVLGKWGIILGLLFPLLIWSRVTLKKHTMAQAVVGGVNAYFLTIVELYLFIYLFNLPIAHVLPLIEVAWIALALVAAPVVLAILGRLRDNGMSESNTRKIFHILAFLGFAFFLKFSTFDGLVSLIIAGPIAILTAYYGGDNFSWWRAIKRSSEKENQTINIPLICSVIWLLVCWFFTKDIIIASTLCVALGDASGELVGKRIGKHKFNKTCKFLSPKSFEGSIAIFIVCSIILAILTQNILISLVIGLILSIVEAISPKGTDNIFIPLICAILMSFLL